MEFKKNVFILMLISILFSNNVWAIPAYSTVPVTITLKKEFTDKKDKTKYDFAIEFKGTSENYPVFMKSSWAEGWFTPKYENKLQPGTYGKLTEQFIKKDTFTFDSEQVGEGNNYFDTINSLVDKTILEQRSRISRMGDEQFVIYEKERLKKAIIRLRDYLKDNVFQYILKNVDQSSCENPHEKFLTTLCSVAKNPLIGGQATVEEPLEGTDLSRVKNTFQIAQTFCQRYQQPSDKASSSITIDLYGETPINKPWREVYWAIQAFCKELGVSTPSIYSWISTSGVKSGLWYSALAAGGSILSYIGYQAYKNPETFAESLRSTAEKFNPIAEEASRRAAEAAKQAAEAVKKAHETGIQIGTATERAAQETSRAAQQAAKAALQESVIQNVR